MKAPAVFTIAPEAPFLPTLAEALVAGTLFPDWPREGPFRLADVTVFLPTRRARDGLADALVAAMGDAPELLPDIRTLGGDDPDAEAFLPPYAEPPPPPAMPRTKRRLMLARLIERWIAAQARMPFSAPGLAGVTGTPNPGEVLALADSLATLIDDFAIAGLSLSDLAAIEAADLPAGWQDALDFVRFVFGVWPDILAEEGEIEGADRTGRSLRRQAAALPALFGDRPVVVAGSTGSIPATAALIAAIARLPRGAVVLPGLDRTLDPKRFATHRNPHGHPQYGLMRLLDTLEVLPSAVEALGPAHAARSATIAQALALADDTAGWDDQHAALAPQLGAAFADVDLVVARSAEEEARAIAIIIRDVLDADPPGTVAVISPDLNLGRRIVAELARFGVDVDDPAGTPLGQSRAGRLVKQLVTLLDRRCTGIDVLALLRNRHVTLGGDRERVARAADWLDFGVLRGQRPTPGLEGLRAGARANRDGVARRPTLKLSERKADAVLDVLDALDKALAPLLTLFAGRFDLSAFAQALGDALAALVGRDTEGLTGWRELQTLLGTLRDHGGHGPSYTAAGLAVALDGIMAGASVRPVRGAREDVHIFGRLEARLMSADTVILAGLVEGVWPEVADPGPWMSRGMRIAVGLEPPEKLHGLAAHDFVMAAGGPRVILSRAERAGTGPATPSRLLQRLEAFVGPGLTAEMTTRGRHWVTLARRLDRAPGLPRPARQPVPRPPVKVREKMMGLSITEIETLIRSPYDLYAKYVLGLREVPALGVDPDAAERGSLVHDVFGTFIARGHDPADPDAQAIMERLAEEIFEPLAAIPERRDIWLRRLHHAAGMFLAFERARAAAVAQRFAEIDGKWIFPREAGGFVLRGRADRIDRLVDGSYEIIDFKTGSVPDGKTMKDLLAPQLPLEAAMVAAGAFADLEPGPTTALTYVKIAAGPNAFDPKPFKTEDGTPLAHAIDATVQLLSGHVGALLRQDTLPLAARVLPNPKQRFIGTYDHLARTEEWTVIGGEEEE